MPKTISSQMLYSFSKFLEREVLKLYSIDRIDGIEASEIDQTNFLEILFCEAYSDSTSAIPYSYSGFRYKFRRIEDPYLWDSFTRKRSRVYPTTTRYYICDNNSESTTNLFSLQSDDLILIRKLLEYKKTGSTNIDSIVYGNLSTNLSKLIYIYLNLKLNDDYSLYNNNTLISSSTSVLECMFETYLIQEMFRHVSGTK